MSVPTASAPSFASNEAATTGAPVATTQGTSAGATGQQDALDKGVDQVLGKLGHKQSSGTTEKISDGVRSLFKKVTGKDVPIQDKQ